MKPGSVLGRLALSIAIALLAACSGKETLAPLPTDATILAFGDSLTYGTGVQATDSYPAVLAELTGFDVVRSGVPGEVSKDGLARLPGELARVDPDLVVICHGGNDTLRRMDLAVTDRNLRAMVRMVREHGAEVVLLAVPQFGLFPSPPDFYESIAEEESVPVEFDVISDLMSDSAMKSDRVHFNRAGYAEVARAVVSMLEDEGAIGR